MSQSDSLDSHPPKAAPRPEPGRELNLVEFPSTSLDSAPHGCPEVAPSISADLLNDIVERARISTNASDAAIALRHGEDIVCLAATGSHAPDIGVRLDLNSGLSGACAQSKAFQRCDDSETDARVDPALCQRLGIRSVLVFPILRHDALLGIVEVFSPNAQAFGDREVQALASLSRTISYILDRPAEPVMPPETSDKISQAAEPNASLSSAPAPVHDIGSQTSATTSAEAVPPSTLRQDYWTTALTVAVIVLAMALGWLLGHGGLRRSSPTVQNPAPAKAALLTQQSVPVAPSASAEAGPSLVTGTAALPSAAKREVAAPQTPRPGELVISQNGKVIYRQSGSQPPGTNLPPAAASRAPAQPGGPSAVMVSPETANQYLAQRVEPEYPEQAREQHIQGPVTLQAVVAKDGSVKALKTIRGDPQLAAAARRAVSQWRFKPFLQEGKPAEFQTNVTVNFRLP